MELYKTLQRKYSNKTFYMVGKIPWQGCISWLCVNHSSDYYKINEGKISEDVHAFVSIQSALNKINLEWDSNKEEYRIWKMNPKSIRVGVNNDEIQFFLKGSDLVQITQGEIDMLKFKAL